MSQEKITLEFIAPTVDEAVETGLNQLGLSRDAVDVEVLDSGSRGLFGLGGRQARIRITILSNLPPQAPAKKETPQAEPAAFSKEPPAAVKTSSEAFPSGQPTAGKAAVQEASSTEEPVETDQALQVAARVTRDLLERMRIRARVTARYIEAEDAADQRLIMVEIQGDDLSILIGRRSETLNALQYITSLIVGKELGQWTPLMIDVQGYRSRRERQLRQLARRMAEQAMATGRRQVLEPMPANERRVIHLELRDHPQVTTESVGEEPGRKVTIYLKK
jgi:spoIIIJ-associated protein